VLGEWHVSSSGTACRGRRAAQLGGPNTTTPLGVSLQGYESRARTTTRSTSRVD
jgi:hypothetical protein